MRDTVHVPDVEVLSGTPEYRAVKFTAVLTRAQVEQAVKDLDQPKLKPGNVVKIRGLLDPLVVTGGNVRQVFLEKFGEGQVCATNGSLTWTGSEDLFEFVRESI